MSQVSEKGRQLLIRSKLTYCHLFQLQVANQIAELTARIARIDCPDDWPELLPILTEVRVEMYPSITLPITN